jgi:hypothetical protein
MLALLMGFLDGIFRKDRDGERDRGLDRAEALLDAGRAYDALVHVQRADGRAERLEPSAATALRARARATAFKRGFLRSTR